MKRLSLQWRITLMSVLLIGITCVAMNLLLCSSGVYYMDTIADSLQGGGTVILNDSGAASFDPQLIAPNEELTIVVDGVQGRFRTTNWYITAAVTLLSGILAYFVSGRALKPLRSFTSQVEQVQLNNLADMRIDEDSISEFRQLSRSFNQMLERLNNAFSAQRQFTGNAAHELRTPLALMQAQLELFSAEHPDVRPETAEFLTLLREQTERLTQMTKTLLEMSNLQQVARNEQLQLAPMVEEIFTDLASLAEKRSITLEAEGDAALTGSDALIYRMLFNLTENAVKYNRLGGSVRVELAQGQEKCIIRVSDTGCGIPEEYQRSIFHPFFRVDKSRSREYGGAGLGLSLVWEIADLHGGSVWVEESSDKGTTIAVELPAGAEKTVRTSLSAGRRVRIPVLVKAKFFQQMYCTVFAFFRQFGIQQQFLRHTRRKKTALTCHCRSNRYSCAGLPLLLFSILNNAIYLHFHVCLNQQCIVIFCFVRPRFRPLELCLIEVLCHHFQRLTVFLVHGKKEERQHHRHHAKSGKAQIPAGFEQKQKTPS